MLRIKFLWALLAAWLGGELASVKATEIAEESFEGKAHIWFSESILTLSQEISSGKKQESLLAHDNCLKEWWVGDRRMQISNIKDFPYRATLSLRVCYEKDKTGSIGIGTAFLIGKGIALTAAHNLYNVNGCLANKIEYYGGIISSKLVYERGEIGYYIFHSHYFDQKPFREAYDYGILMLDKPIGKDLGYLAPKPFAQIEEDRPIGKTVAISGYPVCVGTKEGNPQEVGGNTQYEHKGLIVEPDPPFDIDSNNLDREKNLFYEVDTTAGQSGSAIRYVTADNKHYCVGIHTSGVSEIKHNFNRGVAITADVLQNLKMWVATRDNSGEFITPVPDPKRIKDGRTLDGTGIVRVLPIERPRRSSF